MIDAMTEVNDQIIPGGEGGVVRATLSDPGRTLPPVSPSLISPRAPCQPVGLLAEH